MQELAEKNFPNNPPLELRDWLVKNDVPGLSTLSGKSIKCFRSRMPVAYFEVPMAEFEQCLAFFKKQESNSSADLPEQVIQVQTAESEVKLILQLDKMQDQFHCLVHPAQAQIQGLELSIDDLTFDLKSEEWLGDKDGLADLKTATLYLKKETEVTTADALQVGVLASMLNFHVDPNLIDQAKLAFDADQAAQLPRSMLRKFFRKLVTGAKPSHGFLTLDQIGALEFMLPQLWKGKGLEQNRYHKYDIFYHSMYACDAVKGPNLILRLAALFHDLGKVDTRKEKGNGEASFHNHEMFSARHSEAITRRFGFEPWVGKRIKFLVRNHMFHYTNEWSDKAVRRFVKKVNPDVLQDLITLRLADREGSGKKTALPRAIQTMLSHIEEIRQKEAELKVSDLLINGNTLMEMGMRPSRQMGDLLKELLEQVKAGTLQNETAELLEAVKEYISREGISLDNEYEVKATAPG